MTSTLASAVLLMSTSTTAQEQGGFFALFFSDTVALDPAWYSSVSAMTSLFCVSWHVFAFVQEMPMHFWMEKSLPNIMGHLRCLHTMNVWKKVLPFMLTSHLVLPLALKLSPDAPTKCGILVVFRSFNFNFWQGVKGHYAFHGTCIEKCVNFDIWIIVGEHLNLLCL